ncbi:MAG: hypothetical protein HDQ89_00395 [Desulfovibrio sp.]|nr:hypothetical protein [Desulfovibrio sp.]
MATIRFTEGGREYPIPHSMLTTMAMVCPEGPGGEDLGRAMLALGILSLTESLMYSGFFTTEDRDAIWVTGDIDLRRNLIEEEKFLSRLTDAQARDIVEQDDVDMLKAVGQSAGLLDAVADGGGRISREAADRLLEHVRHHKNVSVRAALAQNPNTPPHLYPPLAEYIRNRYDIPVDYPLTDMSVEDVAQFKGKSRTLLEWLGCQVDEIEDEEAQEAAIRLVAAHPDPGVRLALVECEDTPRLALDLLAGDTDPEIATRVAEKLEQD